MVPCSLISRISVGSAPNKSLKSKVFALSPIGVPSVASPAGESIVSIVKAKLPISPPPDALYPFTKKSPLVKSVIAFQLNLSPTSIQFFPPSILTLYPSASDKAFQLNVGRTTLVILSVLLEPESLPVAKSGVGTPSTRSFKLILIFFVKVLLSGSVAVTPISMIGFVSKSSLVLSATTTSSPTILKAPSLLVRVKVCVVLSASIAVNFPTTVPFVEFS